VDTQARKCFYCDMYGFTFDITVWPIGCLHADEIRIAKEEAKEKHNMWKRLNDVTEEIDIAVVEILGIL